MVEWKLISSRAVSLRAGDFAPVISGFANFLSECFASVLDLAVVFLLNGLNKPAILIPIVRGFSLMPFWNFYNLGSVLWHSDENRDGFSDLGGRDGVLLKNDKRSGLLASGILFSDGKHLRGFGHLEVVWIVTLKSLRILVEDWLRYPSSSKLSNWCSNFSRRERRIEFRPMTDELLLELGFSFNTASIVVFSSSTVAFALLMGKVRHSLAIFSFAFKNFGPFSICNTVGANRRRPRIRRSPFLSILEFRFLNSLLASNFSPFFIVLIVEKKTLIWDNFSKNIWDKQTSSLVYLHLSEYFFLAR